MGDTKVEKCKKDVVTTYVRIKMLSNEFKKAKEYKQALREAKELGTSSKNSDEELSKVNAQIKELGERIETNESLLDKAKQRLYSEITEQRKSDEAEMMALYQPIANFRKDCLKELEGVIVEAQILANLARGERFGTDLLHCINFLFDTESSSYIQLIKKIERLTRERYQGSPLGKQENLEAKINSWKEISVATEAEKLLSAALEEVTNTIKEESDVTGK